MLRMSLTYRYYTNEGELYKINAVFVGSSNFIPDEKNPEDKYLMPFYDRFGIKILGSYLNDKQLVNNAVRKNKTIRRAQQGTPVTITLDEIKEAQQDILDNVTCPDDLTDIVFEVVKELREKNGIKISDRRLINFWPICCAEAWLNGRNTVTANDLMILKNYFWMKPSEISIVESTLEKYSKNQLKEEMRNIILMADEIKKENMSFNTTESKSGVALQLKKMRKEMIRLFDMTQACKVNSDTDKDLVSDTVKKLQEMSDEMHKYLQYTPLSFKELKDMI